MAKESPPFPKNIAVPVEALIAVDIGNTQVHLGRFEDFRAEGVTPPVATFSFPTSSTEYSELRTWLGGERLPWYVVSVHRPGLASLDAFAKAEPCVASFTRLTSDRLPLAIDLPQPAAVGADRLAAAVAANGLRDGDRPVIVVDAGTAITVDAVSSDGTFLGGAILPGLRVVARALALRTDALPEVEVDLSARPAAIGRSTVEALHSGLFWGTVGAVKETIGRISAEIAGDHPPHIYVSGGDVQYLAPWLNLPVEPVDHLVLRGVALAAQLP